MKVSELMTEKVLTIGPEAPIKDVAKVLVANGISGLPVCDIEGDVLGVISEADILYKEHDPAESHIGGPLGWIIEGPPDSKTLIKAEALTARQAMTSPAITIAPYESVSYAARIMSERHVNRLPVVHHEKLVGIVTRGDLVRAFARTDAELEEELKQDVLQRVMWIDPGKVAVNVENGVATLSGRLPIRSDVEMLSKLAARIPGIVAVESTVEWDVDETTRKGRRSLERTVR